MFEFRARALAELRAHVESGYPEERCGLLIAAPEEPLRITRCLPGKNLLVGAAARRGFELDSRWVLAQQEQALASGRRVVSLYHSHSDSPATLSTRDRGSFILGAVPAWEFALTVVRVDEGLLAEIRHYRFDSSAHDYREVGLG